MTIEFWPRRCLAPYPVPKPKKSRNRRPKLPIPGEKRGAEPHRSHRPRCPNPSCQGASVNPTDALVPRSGHIHLLHETAEGPLGHCRHMAGADKFP